MQKDVVTMPKPIRRSDGKLLKFAGVTFENSHEISYVFAKSDVQDIADTFEKVMVEGFYVEPSSDHYYYLDDDDDSCIEMN